MNTTPARALSVLLVACATACGDEETYTPDACPPQNLYDIRELYAPENQSDPEMARLRASVEAEIEAAAEKGCVTAPTFTPQLSDAP